ncbi:MAG: hypothetical protein JKY34_08690 [Kordiimonadaceae bacterium]|nr:hypothetical protein [Kordiimonadaceae bacterium]
MITYIEQLRSLAGGNDDKLLQAFRNAGVNDTTYYRASKKQHGLSEKAAFRVYDQLIGGQHDGISPAASA